MKRYALAVAVTLLVAPPVSAEKLGLAACFFGYVSTGAAPVPGATIYFVGPSMSGTRTEHADESGRFCASPFPQGELTIRVQAPGYRSRRDTVLAVRYGFRVPLLLLMDRIDDPSASLVPDPTPLAAPARNMPRCSCLEQLEELDGPPKFPGQK